MKNRRHNFFALVILLSFLISASAVSVNAATEEQIEQAVADGIDWLIEQQDTVSGKWQDVPRTGFVLIKLQERAIDLGKDPFETDSEEPDYYEFATNVIAGWEYLFTASGNVYVGTYARKKTISDQPNGDPDTNGNGYGISFSDNGYYTGICLMALASSEAPDRENDGGLDYNGDGNPDTLGQIAQEVVDWLAWAQSDTGSGRGGWRYVANSGADNSVSGYTVLGLAAAKGFGCTIPGFVIEELDEYWVNYIQHASGGSGYDHPASWVNLLKTGNLIFQMTFCGDFPSSPRFQKAMDYIEDHWNDLNRDPGWGKGLNPSHYQAMYCLMKGLEYSQIELIDLTGDAIPEHNWYDEFAQVLVDQQVDGHWPIDVWGNCEILSTVWALLTLEKVAPPPPYGIEPEFIEDTLYPGETEYDTITVTLPRSIPKGDVVFLFDATGSMNWIIADMQTKAINIMSGIRAQIPDTAFGVGSFTDYPDFYDSYGYADTYGADTDYAFTMDQDITTDATTVSNAINNIVYGSGWDIPEDYTRAVWETQHYSWREGAKKIVVLFGDAPVHSAPSGLTLVNPWDPPSGNLFTSAYGGDPGPNEIMDFTDDDLDYAPVVQEAADNHITFICVDCQPLNGLGYYDDAHNNLEYIAYVTGGSRFLHDSGTIDIDIINRIKAEAEEPIGEITLETDSSWVTWSPEAYYDVEWTSTVSFDIEITAPYCTYPGDYTIEIDVLLDGVKFGTVTVLKHILNHPPVADAGPDQTLEQTSYAGAEVTLDGSGSYDPDYDPLSYTWTWDGGSASGETALVTFPLGSHEVTLTVDDGKGGTDTDEVVITVIDTTEPELIVADEPIVLWPPNHKYHSITISDFVLSVSDLCDGDLTIDDVIITKVTSDEPENAIGQGDGNTLDDIVIVDDQTVNLRAERQGNGDGRVYTIYFEVTDASGNTATGSFQVWVPHDQGAGSTAIDSGIAYTVFNPP
ncbi:MAG: PKD domain-containing protein [Candidatus Hodarchaeota archaeon]